MSCVFISITHILRSVDDFVKSIIVRISFLIFPSSLSLLYPLKAALKLSNSGFAKVFSSKSKYSDKTILSKALKLLVALDFILVLVTAAKSLDFKVEDFVTTVTFLPFPFPLMSPLWSFITIALYYNRPTIIIGNILNFICSYIILF